MKNILLSSALLFATGLSAQTYFQDDFSGDITTNWTLVDRDGDTQNWFTFDSGAGQGKVATSASWNQAALNPDNWMISNAVDLSSASGTVNLSWKAFGQDPDFADENYTVYVGTSNDPDVLINSTVNFNEIIGTGTTYQSRSINVSSFIGQTIYIAFRHHNVSDQFRLNIDDVKVYTSASNDLELSDITVDKKVVGNRTFSFKVTNLGLNAVTSFDLDYTIGGQTYTENVTGINLASGNDHVVSVQKNIPSSGSQTISAVITTSDDDANNNSKSVTINFFPMIPQYLSTDIHGNSFDLHDRLSKGQAIILDFMASWCPPCLQSTPELSEFIQNNGSGLGDVEALAITVEADDDVSVMQGLNWNGGFYEYPKFAYTTANNNQYYHYSINLDLNPGGSIPFFLMICPNQENPEASTIVKYSVGFGAGMFGTYQPILNECMATMDVVDFTKEELDFKVYPNPANSIVNIEFDLNIKSDVAISIINTVGQTVLVQDLGKVSGSQSTQLDVSVLKAGMYIVKIKTASGEKTQRISIL